MTMPPRSARILSINSHMETEANMSERCESVSKPSRFRFGLAALLCLITIFAGIAALVRTRFELERKYESDAKKKITSLLAIPGLRVETAFELDSFFRLRFCGATILVPRSYCRGVLDRTNGLQLVPEQ